MAKNLLGFFLFGTFDRDSYKGIENRRATANLYALRLISSVMVVILAVISTISLLDQGHFDFILHPSHLPVYFTFIAISAVMFASSYVLRSQKFNRIRFLHLYTQVLVVYALMIYIGTYVSTSSNAVIFFVTLVSVPMLIHDHPYRINSLNVCVVLIFLYLSHEVKGANFYHSDTVNALVSLAISIVICIFVEHLRLSEWRSTKVLIKKQHKDRFIADMIHYASASKSPEEMIPELLEYICTKINCDRAYIFEINEKKTYDNTYEFCRQGVTPQIDNLQDVPYEGMLDVWFHEFDEKHTVIIEDIEEYKSVSQPLYDILKPQDIHSLVTGPIEIDGKVIGFYGVDNPPREHMPEIPDTISMIEYVICMVLRLRNDAREISMLSLRDPLTGLNNRRALEDYIAGLETNEPVALIMADLNGLKVTNDTKGHGAGDALIIRAVAALVSVFDKNFIFRIGGDEFLTFVIGDSEDVVIQKINDLRARCDQNEVSLAVGMNYVVPPFSDYDNNIRIADERMYLDKSEYYKMHDRRKR